MLTSLQVGWSSHCNNFLLLAFHFGRALGVAIILSLTPVLMDTASQLRKFLREKHKWFDDERYKTTSEMKAFSTSIIHQKKGKLSYIKQILRKTMDLVWALIYIHILAWDKFSGPQGLKGVSFAPSCVVSCWVKLEFCSNFVILIITCLAKFSLTALWDGQMLEEQGCINNRPWVFPFFLPPILFSW